MPQRHTDDTFFGEQVLSNTKTGMNTADNIRYDVMDGITSAIRRYNKKGIKHGFGASVFFRIDIPEASVKQAILSEHGRTADTVAPGSWGVVDNYDYNLAEMSKLNELHWENHVESGVDCIGRVTEDGGTEKSFTEIFLDPNYESISFRFWDGAVWETNYSGYTSPINIGAAREGYHTTYTVGPKTYQFYSVSATLHEGVVTSSSTVMPIVAFQDNANEERPYETLPWGDTRYDYRRRVLRTIGADFQDMSRQVFPWIPPYSTYPGSEWYKGYGNQYRLTPRLQEKYPSEGYYHEIIAQEVAVPAFESPEWNRDYGSTYRSMKRTCANGRRVTVDQYEFCNKYDSERAYYDSMVSDKYNSADGIKNITDAHLGFFASAKLLAESNVVALFYTLLEILPQTTKNAPRIPIGISDILSQTPSTAKVYGYSISNGSFKADYTFNDWSVCRRMGIANIIKYPPGGGKNPKYKSAVHVFGYATNPALPVRGWDEFLPRDSTYEHTRAPDNPTPTNGANDDEGVGTNPDNMIELRVQDRPDAAGNPRYLEMRLYSPRASHIVDVIRDGKHGKSGSVVIRGGLNGIWKIYNPDDEEDVPYSDVLCYPLSYNAIREVPLFKRERLMREALIIRISAINMQEVKWYQQGWFKIVMIIVALVLAYFTGGQSIVAVLKALAVMVVTQILLALVDNPVLRAIIMIIAIIYGGYSGGAGTWTFDPSMLVEATGVVLQTKIAMDMMELQDEMRELMKEMSEKQEEFRKMSEEVGNDNYNKDFMLYAIGLSPVETQEDWVKRTLNSSLPPVETHLPNTESELPAPDAAELR